jgi:hypothetical protein
MGNRLTPYPFSYSQRNSNLQIFQFAPDFGATVQSIAFLRRQPHRYPGSKRLCDVPYLSNLHSPVRHDSELTLRHASRAKTICSTDGAPRRVPEGSGYRRQQVFPDVDVPSDTSCPFTEQLVNRRRGHKSEPPSIHDSILSSPEKFLPQQMRARAEFSLQVRWGNQDRK